MRKNPNLIVPHRRHREGRTDYHQRLELLKSREPRLVVRKSLNCFYCQIVRYEEKGDKVIASAVSSELKDFGWKFHGGNTPAAYLTGLLCAERAKKHKVSKAILDIGLYKITPGNTLFSALKGAVDGGLNIPYNEKILPSEDRISGKHIAAYAEAVKSDAAKYKKLFSAYVKDKADPSEMPVVFEATKKTIMDSKGERKKSARKAEHKEAKEHKHEEKKHEHNSDEHAHHEHTAEHKEAHHEHKHAEDEHKSAEHHKTEHKHTEHHKKE